MQTIKFFLISLTIMVMSAAQADSNLRTSSTLSVLSVFMGPSVLMDGSTVIVQGIEAMGSSLLVTVKTSVKDSVGESKVVLELSSDLAQQAGLAVGSSIQVVASSTGHALIASGKLIGFIPNELGKSLLHHSSHGG